MLKLPVDPGRDNFAGCATAPIELVEYGDFQCKYSAEAYIVIKLLQQCLGDQLKFVFRHYPIPALHSLALDAAVASEAAALQGKFWYMHDMIFENQQYLVRSSFSRFAEEIELDLTTYENTTGNKKLIYKVVNDFESGARSGVISTPTFFINGKKYNGFCDFESMYKTCRYAMNIERIEA